LYARKITLRNCGRFTLIKSDFGAHYTTHTHVTGEALYASLTRGATWRPRTFDLKNDPSLFSLSYDVEALPIWFSPGFFLVEDSFQLAESHLDRTYFNVLNEIYPSTGSTTQIRGDGMLEENKRSPKLPTYGTIQSVLPDHRMVVYGFSAEQAHLSQFEQDQIFLLGKKRTMFQITDISPVVEGIAKEGTCTTGWLELPPTSAKQFHQFEIAEVTQRYLLIRGITRNAVHYLEFSLEEKPYCLPDFYLETIPFHRGGKG
jgi:hypothetical protein